MASCCSWCKLLICHSVCMSLVSTRFYWCRYVNVFMSLLVHYVRMLALQTKWHNALLMTLLFMTLYRYRELGLASYVYDWVLFNNERHSLNSVLTMRWSRWENDGTKRWIWDGTPHHQHSTQSSSCLDIGTDGNLSETSMVRILLTGWHSSLYYNKRISRT